MLGRLLLFALFFKVTESSCPNGSNEWQENCLIFNSNATGFAIAEITCNKLGGHLASIHDGFANAVIGEYAPNYFHESTEADFWIGANTLLSRGNWSWTDGGVFDYNDWNKGEPQNATGSECVAVSLSDGYWTAQECSKSKPFVCNLPNAPPTITIPTSASPTTGTPNTYVNCSAGWIYFEPTQSCYGGHYKGNWSAAESYCLKHGGHLSSVHSYEEIKFLFTFVYTFSVPSDNLLWLGLYTIDSGNSWQWTDNSPVDYTTWNILPAHDISGQSCVYLTWISADIVPVFFNYDCSYNWFTICKKKI